jgi:hypothetical protein
MNEVVLFIDGRDEGKFSGLNSGSFPIGLAKKGGQGILLRKVETGGNLGGGVRLFDMRYRG